ncbi:MAG: hypothetical protein C0489_12155, partial [Candidatus Accumulibacter sp.]|nr:hypothetical protein [Accumulibacter sp.]
LLSAQTRQMPTSRMKSRSDKGGSRTKRRRMRRALASDGASDNRQGWEGGPITRRRAPCYPRRMAGDSVESWLATVDPAQRPALDRLRAIIRAAAGADVTEGIKWNSPNFAQGGEDRVTLNLCPKGSLRLILHRGAKVKDTAGFAFDDPAGLARWPTPDRGIVSFRDAGELEAKAAALADLVHRWIAALR